jgi:hypothetical protein
VVAVRPAIFGAPLFQAGVHVAQGVAVQVDDVACRVVTEFHVAGLRRGQHQLAQVVLAAEEGRGGSYHPLAEKTRRLGFLRIARKRYRSSGNLCPFI